MKKLLQATILLLALLLPNVVNAHDFVVNGIYYLGYSNGNATVTFSGNIWWGWEEQDYHYTYSGDVVIPSSVTYNGKTYTVTGINDGAFYGCDVTSVTMPNTITWIGSGAFMECSQLTSITIPNITQICDRVFQGCSGLTSITIPNSVTEIWQLAFAECTGLTSIYIPSGVNYIQEAPLMGCDNLTEVIVASDNPYYDSREGCNAIIETESNLLISGCKSTVIPSSVESIGLYAFSRLGITEITIPEGVISIAPWAFENCSGLTNVTIPSSVKYIDLEAFGNCYSLKDVYSYINPSDPDYYYDYYMFYLESEDYMGRTLHVPAGSLAFYQENEAWYLYFGKIVEMSDGPALPGDVDGDGEVSIADVTVLVDLLLAGATDPNGADVDGDGEVSISDVSALIDYLLTGSW